MDAHGLDELRAAREAAGRPYHEFLRVPSMSAGFYHLPAGGVDPQSPHDEDEIYVAMHGRARITVGDEARAVSPGDVVFVAAQGPHHLHPIAAGLAAVVVFAPAAS